MTKNIPESVNDALNENQQDLIGVWAWTSPTVFLDNLSVNAAEQIVNGTICTIDSLLWIEKSVQRIMEGLIREYIKCIYTETFLDTPTCYVMVSLTDRKTHKPRSK